MNKALNSSTKREAVAIGTLQESSLHAALKDWLAKPGDQLEVPVDGYLIDIVRTDLLLEIQTSNFSALKVKLDRLLASHRVRVIYPVAFERWICRVSKDNRPISRRKSPKRGRFEEVFAQLLRIPRQATHPNFSLEILLTQEEIEWRDDGRGSWRRRGWSVSDRRLLTVLERMSLHKLEDFLGFLPANLADPFTNRELAEALGIRPQLAQKMTYCLRYMGLLSLQGKRGRYNLYAVEGIEGRT
jgi:hypothetical protein